MRNIIRKLRVNVGKSRVKSCSRYIHECRWDARVKDEDCSSTFGRKWRMWDTMKEGYKAWGTLESVLSNRGLGTNAKK